MGTTYVPKIKDLMLAVCIQPPTIAVIRQALIDCLLTGIPKMTQIDAIPFINLKNHLEKRAGDKDFMLKVLAHITERDHVFFATNYVPPSKQVVNALQYEFDN